MSDEIPDPWRTAAERKGVRTSYRGFAAAADVSHETARKVILGRRTSSASIRKVADALGVDVELVHEWRGEAAPDYGREFVPDQAAWLLTTEEREAVNSIIRLLTRDRSDRKEVGSHGDSAATTQGAAAPDRDIESGEGASVSEPGQVYTLDGRRRRAAERSSEGPATVPEQRAVANEDETIATEGEAQEEQP